MSYIPVTTPKKRGPKPSGRTALIRANVTPRVANWVRAEAAKQGVKTAEIVRRAMAQYMQVDQQRPAPPPKPTLAARIKRSLGL